MVARTLGDAAPGTGVGAQARQPDLRNPDDALKSQRSKREIHARPILKREVKTMTMCQRMWRPGRTRSWPAIAFAMTVAAAAHLITVQTSGLHSKRCERWVSRACASWSCRTTLGSTGSRKVIPSRSRSATPTTRTRRLAERVGFVPVEGATLNDLGLN